MAWGVLLSLLAYLSGSIPSGTILTKRRAKMDITAQGSGNIGATNVLRQAGPALGIATLVADMAKGALPVLAATHICQSSTWIAVTAVCAFLGHLYPVYTMFKKGGKGVATAAGGTLVFAPLAMGASLLVFAAAVGISRRASVGSLAASAALCPTVILVSGSWPLFSASIVMTILIWIRHRDNIKRLLAGEEPRIF